MEFMQWAQEVLNAKKIYVAALLGSIFFLVILIVDCKKKLNYTTA